MVSPIGPLTSSYLRICGYSDIDMENFNSDTRILQDMGISGDNAWDEFLIMYDEFGVDFAGFDMNRYFPSELSWENFIFKCFSSSRIAKAIGDKYPEITLGMLEDIIERKSWR